MRMHIADGRRESPEVGDREGDFGQLVLLWGKWVPCLVSGPQAGIQGGPRCG